MQQQTQRSNYRPRRRRRRYKDQWPSGQYMPLPSMFACPTADDALEKVTILRTTAWLHPNVVLQPALLAPFRAFSCRYEIFYQTDPHHRLSSNLSVRGKLGLLCSFTQERVVLSSPTRKRVQHQAIDSAAVTAQQQVVLLQPIPNACLYDMENVVPDTSEQAKKSA